MRKSVTAKTFKRSEKVARANRMLARAIEINKRRQQGLQRRNLRSGGFLGIEEKFLDTFQAAQLPTPADCTGGEIDPTTYNCLNAVAQGDGESNRDGKNYVITSIHFRGTVQQTAQANQTATDEGGQYFVALVWDKQTNAAQLNSEDVFKNASASTTQVVNLFRNLQYSKRFVVLKVWRGSLMPPTMSYDGTNIEVNGVTKQLSFDKKVDIRVETKGTSANVTDIVNNSLHVVGFSQGAVINLNYCARIRFRG